MRIVTRFADDEKSTRLETVLVMKVGAIHWHAAPRTVVRFRADESRATIREVETGGDPNDASWRVMECTDCHNRVGHLARSAEDEVDLALADGRLDRTLPFLKREAMKAGGFDISLYNSNDTWMLPVPATFVVGCDGLVKARYIDPDYRRRMELDAIVDAVAAESATERRLRSA